MSKKQSDNRRVCEMLVGIHLPFMGTNPDGVLYRELLLIGMRKLMRQARKEGFESRNLFSRTRKETVDAE